MAEGEDRSSEDLTEEVSSYRLEEARRKGQVAQSRELTGMMALLATACVAYALSPKMGAQVAEFMREVFRTDFSSKLDLGSGHVLEDLLLKALKLAVFIGLPISLAGFAMGVLGSFVQIGSIFSTDPLTPDLNKLNPLQGLARMFSLRQLKASALLIFKMVIVIAMAYGIVKSEVLNSPALLASEPVVLFSAISHATQGIFFPLIAILMVFAGVDWWFQRAEYMKGMKLTKEEAKQEHKEREGDPKVKARIRMIQREMARKRMMQAVKTADVIVTNPTHFAVALKYDKENMAAPKVVAKGADFMAQRIKKIAADAGVPLVENVPLARALHKSVKVGQYIPRALYQAVAEVLAHVYRLRNGRY